SPRGCCSSPPADRAWRSAGSSILIWRGRSPSPSSLDRQRHDRRRLMTQIVGLDPSSGPLKRPEGEAVPRNLVTLDGAVVGLVANGLGRGEELMQALYAELGGRAELAGALP